MNKQEFIEHANDLGAKIGLSDGAMREIFDVANIAFAIPTAREKCEVLTEMLFTNAWGLNEETKEFAETLPCGEDQFALFMCIYYSYYTKIKFIDRGYCVDVYYDTMKELITWTEWCFRRTGRWGMLDYVWVCRILRMGLIQLGRFLFGIEKYRGIDYEHAGVKITKGDKVICIHIPEGDSITREKRMDAYKKAYKFFNQTGKAVFTCESWLFYEKHKEFLPENSNILDFMKDFEYVHHRETSKPEDMWRMFGYRRSYDDIDSLPQNTGLQKAYAKWWTEHHTMGEAYGVLVFDGEKIL